MPSRQSFILPKPAPKPRAKSKKKKKQWNVLPGYVIPGHVVTYRGEDIDTREFELYKGETLTVFEVNDNARWIRVRDLHGRVTPTRNMSDFYFTKKPSPVHIELPKPEFTATRISGTPEKEWGVVINGIFKFLLSVSFMFATYLCVTKTYTWLLSEDAGRAPIIIAILIAVIAGFPTGFLGYSFFPNNLRKLTFSFLENIGKTKPWIYWGLLLVVAWLFIWRVLL